MVAGVDGLDLGRATVDRRRRLERSGETASTSGTAASSSSSGGGEAPWPHEPESTT